MLAFKSSMFKSCITHLKLGDAWLSTGLVWSNKIYSKYQFFIHNLHSNLISIITTIVVLQLCKAILLQKHHITCCIIWFILVDNILVKGLMPECSGVKRNILWVCLGWLISWGCLMVRYKWNLFFPFLVRYRVNINSYVL